MAGDVRNFSKHDVIDGGREGVLVDFHNGREFDLKIGRRGLTKDMKYVKRNKILFN